MRIGRSPREVEPKTAVCPLRSITANDQPGVREIHSNESGSGDESAVSVLRGEPRVGLGVQSKSFKCIVVDF